MNSNEENVVSIDTSNMSREEMNEVMNLVNVVNDAMIAWYAKRASADAKFMITFTSSCMTLLMLVMGTKLWGIIVGLLMYMTLSYAIDHFTAIGAKNKMIEATQALNNAISSLNKKNE